MIVLEMLFMIWNTPFCVTLILWIILFLHLYLIVVAACLSQDPSEKLVLNLIEAFLAKQRKDKTLQGLIIHVNCSSPSLFSHINSSLYPAHLVASFMIYNAQSILV